MREVPQVLMLDDVVEVAKAKVRGEGIFFSELCFLVWDKPFSEHKILGWYTENIALKFRSQALIHLLGLTRAEFYGGDNSRQDAEEWVEHLDVILQMRDSGEAGIYSGGGMERGWWECPFRKEHVRHNWTKELAWCGHGVSLEEFMTDGGAVRSTEGFWTVG